jgi:hypothetical protein
MINSIHYILSNFDSIRHIKLLYKNPKNKNYHKKDNLDKNYEMKMIRNLISESDPSTKTISIPLN